MGGPFISPLRKREDDWGQFLALFGELVLIIGGPIAGCDFGEDAAVHQLIETNRECVFGDPQRRLEVCETSRAEHGVTDDQQGPPGSNQVEGARNGALHV